MFKNDVYFWKIIKYFIIEHKYSQEMPNTPKNREQIVSRVCFVKEAQQKSLTIDQFIGKLHAMVDDFYSAKT